MRGAYLRSDVFYSFWFRPLSRQHPAFAMYIRGVLFVCLFIVVELVQAKAVVQSSYN